LGLFTISQGGTFFGVTLGSIIPFGAFSIPHCPWFCNIIFDIFSTFASGLMDTLVGGKHAPRRKIPQERKGRSLKGDFPFVPEL